MMNEKYDTVSRGNCGIETIGIVSLWCHKSNSVFALNYVSILSEAGRFLLLFIKSLSCGTFVRGFETLLRADSGTRDDGGFHCMRGNHMSTYRSIN